MNNEAISQGDIILNDYNYILTKLKKTILRYGSDFKEFEFLYNRVFIILSQNWHLTFKQRLENVSDMLKEKGTDSPIISALHKEVYGDLELLRVN